MQNTLNSKTQQYYIKAKNYTKENKPNKSTAAQKETQSQISLILNKMNLKHKIEAQFPSSDRAGKPSLQTSPKMSHYLSTSNLLSRTTQSPKVNTIDLLGKQQQTKDSSNRITDEEQMKILPTYLNGIMEMEERRRQLDRFKEQLSQNNHKLTQLQQLQIQTELMEGQLLAVIKSIQLVKEQLLQQLSQEQQIYQQNLNQIKESMKKMEDDICFNQQNIVESMQMKPFQNIMQIYSKRVEEHSNCLTLMINRRQQITQFNSSCQGLMLKMQSLLDPKQIFASFGNKIEKENQRCTSNKVPESPCFKK